MASLADPGASTPIATEPLAGGFAELTREGVTARRLTVCLDEQRFELPWDPREDGTVLGAAPAKWLDASGAPLDEATRDRVLDGFWLLAKKHARIRAIFQYMAALDCCILYRSDRPMIRVTSDAAEILLQGKTAHLKYEKRGLTEAGKSIAALLRADASWRYPTEKPLSDAEWKELTEHFLSAEPSQLFLSHLPWQFTLSDDRT